jgi:hypothetical protein
VLHLPCHPKAEDKYNNASRSQYVLPAAEVCCQKKAKREDDIYACGDNKSKVTQKPQDMQAAIYYFYHYVAEGLA